MTRVVHKKKESFDVDISRPRKWGNQFRIGPDGTRAEVIAKFRKDLLQRIRRDPQLLMELLNELKDKTLGCWCNPLPCHGDVYAAVCDGRLKIGFRRGAKRRKK